MKKIIINFAHPAKFRSKTNTSLLKAISSLENIYVNDLYAEYPDFDIDINREQKLCEEHDIIIFQHPFYWYSTPSIIKEWQDLVLEHGWAYGSKGLALKDKLITHCVTAGGGSETYSKNGFNENTIPAFLAPFSATAKLCKMNWLPPFVIMDVHRGLDEVTIQKHCTDYKKCILKLRDSELSLDEVTGREFLNSIGGE